MMTFQARGRLTSFGSAQGAAHRLMQRDLILQAREPVGRKREVGGAAAFLCVTIALPLMEMAI